MASPPRPDEVVLEMNDAPAATPTVPSVADDNKAAHVVHSAASHESLKTAKDRLEIAIQDISFRVKVPGKPVEGQGKRQKVQPVDKVILDGITGVFRPGRLTAVMGASGAGKTSLLNVLAGEVSGSGVGGKMLINGTVIATGKEMKGMSGFVFQDDVILDTMTVREAITMSAILRLPQTISMVDKLKRVDELLTMLRLTKAANTIIGNTTIKGISGGERKRTALAMEMVTNPDILFLDEPTSGLDTFTAFNVCDILRTLARTGRTVIATIHQPSSETFHLFDDLCLLAEGQVMYWGPVDELVGYFDGLGYKCPNYTNPADYVFMSILNTEKQDASADKALKTTIDEDKARINTLLGKWKEGELNKKLVQSAHREHDVKGASKSAIKYRSDFVTQFKYLFGRAGLNAIRNKFIIRVKLMQSLFISLLIGLIYLNQPSKSGEKQLQNYQGSMFFICVNMVMGSSIGILSIFSLEKAVFIREHTNGYYSLAAYFMSKTLVELPHQMIFPFIQTSIMYWMVGFTNDPGWSFVVFAVTIMFLGICGSALGVFFAAVFQDLTVALAVTPMVLLPLMIFSGLFVQNDSIPVYFDWIKYLSPIKYGFEALVKTQFNSNWSAHTSKGALITGPAVVTSLGLDDGLDVPSLLFILLGMYFALLVLAYFAMRRAINLKK